MGAPKITHEFGFGVTDDSAKNLKQKPKLSLLDSLILSMCSLSFVTFGAYMVHSGENIIWQIIGGLGVVFFSIPIFILFARAALFQLTCQALVGAAISFTILKNVPFGCGLNAKDLTEVTSSFIGKFFEGVFFYPEPSKDYSWVAVHLIYLCWLFFKQIIYFSGAKKGAVSLIVTTALTINGILIGCYLAGSFSVAAFLGVCVSPIVAALLVVLFGFMAVTQLGGSIIEGLLGMLGLKRK
jgi:hypothetical protein